jgi:hypothetical protein
METGIIKRHKIAALTKEKANLCGIIERINQIPIKMKIDF